MYMNANIAFHEPHSVVCTISNRIAPAAAAAQQMSTKSEIRDFPASDTHRRGLEALPQRATQVRIFTSSAPAELRLARTNSESRRLESKPAGVLYNTNVHIVHCACACVRRCVRNYSF